ncbi:hypothetical protein Hypma_014510 [Hypsizygus marmoreus]|uniref:Uncharacterized protein n=1 Tax=Hypsizygus marmoreus TaxID=39966 RepID=A0A369JA06_HYPMA|nr:hypothetical protein Hypma_014510 [Hypsizygus marmoreus]
MRPSSFFAFIALLAAPAALAQSYDDYINERGVSTEQFSAIKARDILDALYAAVERRALAMEEHNDLATRGAQRPQSPQFVPAGVSTPQNVPSHLPRFSPIDFSPIDSPKQKKQGQGSPIDLDKERPKNPPPQNGEMMDFEYTPPPPPPHARASGTNDPMDFQWTNVKVQGCHVADAFGHLLIYPTFTVRKEEEGRNSHSKGGTRRKMMTPANRAFPPR